jgi:hypothetical protein
MNPAASLPDGHPYALELEHCGEQLEVLVGVQNPEATLGCRRGDQVVDGRDATPGAEIAAGPERSSAHRSGEGSLGESPERLLEGGELLLVPCGGEDLQRSGRAADQQLFLDRGFPGLEDARLALSVPGRGVDYQRRPEPKGAALI